MLRALRTLLRAAGWLLTPVLVWGAAFAGSWAGARLAGYVTPTLWAVAVAAAGALATGGAMLVLWVRALRRLGRAAAAERRERRTAAPVDASPERAPQLVTVDEAAD